MLRKIMDKKIELNNLIIKFNKKSLDNNNNKKTK